jgi:hypothetical protein
MKTKSVVLFLTLLLFFSPALFSQSRETGAIVGTVFDPDGNPLPGVTVTITSPNLMGVRTAVTGGDGSYRFPALRPGEYTAKAELQGFSTMIREYIRLSTTVRLTVDFHMKLKAVEEQVTVIAQSPTVDIKSTETASVTLSSDILRNIPYSQFTSDIVNMAPGVNNDVAYGASAGTGISWQMDGVGVGDPDYGTAWVFLDHNIVEEAKVMGVGVPAEYGNFTGVIFNLITKSGGNQLSGHFEADFQGAAKHADLKGDWPSGFWGTDNNSAYVHDFPELTAPSEKLLDANAHLGGPIIKDKLWFFAGLQWYHSWSWQPGFPFAQNYKQPRGFIKLTSQLSKTTNISGSVEYDNYNGTYRGASSRVSPEATVNQIDPEYVLNLGLTHIFSAKTFLDIKAAYFNGYYNLEPRTGRDVAARFFQNDNPALPPGNGNKRYFSSGYYAEHPRWRFQANASLTHYAEDFIKGNHDFKFGVEFERSNVRNLYAYTGRNNMYYMDYWGYGYTGNYLAYQYQGYDTNSRFARLEAFAQDSWQITPRLNIGLGVRFSQNWGWVKYIDGTLWNTNRIAPRIGFTFDILGDKSTILKAHYGHFTEGMYASLYDRLNPKWYDKTYFYWDLGSEEWVEYRKVSHGIWKIADNIKHPYLEQFTVGIERELFKDASFSITYINRNYREIVGAVDNLATWAERSQFVADLDKTFTIYTLTSGDVHDYVITNIKEGMNGITAKPYRKYWGLEFLFNKRFSNKWQFLASYVYSKSKGTIDNGGADDIGYGNYNYFPFDPNFWLNADGNSTNDPTHMIKVQATYVLPLGIYFNAYFRAITGDAWTTRFRTARLPQGRVTFFTEQRGSNHYPMQKTLDLRLEKTFMFSAKYRLGLIVDVFNVFNDATTLDWGTRIGYDWTSGDFPSTNGHDLYYIALPRRARVGIRLIF